MTRFATSLLAGVLVVGGGYYGWQSGDVIASAAGQAADRVEHAVGAPGAAAGGSASGSRAATSSRSRTPGPGATSTHRRTSPRATRTPDYPLGRECTTPGPTSAAGMNSLFRKLSSTPSLEGADHGGSIALADGRRMFVFGDTIRDESMYRPFMVRNSVLVTTAGCLTPMRTDDDGAVIPNRSSTTGYWPMSMRASKVDDGTVVQVMTTRVRRTGVGQFVTAGPGLATFKVPTGRMPGLVSHVDLGPDVTDPRVPTWGASMWDSGGWVYVFGTASNADKSTFGWSLHVARTRPSDLADPKAWEYWDGAAWRRGAPTATTSARGTLIPAQQGVSHVLSVFERRGSWYALSKEGDYTGSQLTVWKAPSVTGPWVKHRLTSLANDAEVRRYTPLAHPDFVTSSGRLLVSYSQGPQTSRPFFTNPELYRPQFIEVDLP